MKLSLAEAARLLNKSERQVRYLIRHGKLQAQKDGGRWVIRRQDLPLSEKQEKAASQKAERAARLAVEVLQPQPEEGKGKGRFSVRQLRAFQTGRKRRSSSTPMTCIAGSWTESTPRRRTVKLPERS